MLDDGALSRFGPLFQIERAGGQFVLAAMQVPEDRFDAVAAQVNALPEVAHNYRREHRFNMWFVLACTVAPAQARRRMRAHRGRDRAARVRVPEGEGILRRAAPAGLTLQSRPSPADDFDRRLIAATQAGLPLVPRPYDAVGAQLGVSGAAVRERLAGMLREGLVRRIGAVPNHYALGYTANGMTVWDVDDARVDELGEKVGALGFVIALLPPAARAARLALQPVRDGARPPPRRGRALRAADPLPAGRGLPRPRHPLQQPHPEEDRAAAAPPSRIIRHVPHLPVHARARRRRARRRHPAVKARRPAGPVVIWNLIRRCNLTCKHCYALSADHDYPGELTARRGFTR